MGARPLGRVIQEHIMAPAEELCSGSWPTGGRSPLAWRMLCPLTSCHQPVRGAVPRPHQRKRSRLAGVSDEPRPIFLIFQKKIIAGVRLFSKNISRKTPAKKVSEIFKGWRFAQKHPIWRVPLFREDYDVGMGEALGNMMKTQITTLSNGYGSDRSDEVLKP